MIDEITWHRICKLVENKIKEDPVGLYREVEEYEKNSVEKENMTDFIDMIDRLIKENKDNV